VAASPRSRPRVGGTPQEQLARLRSGSETEGACQAPSEMGNQRGTCLGFSLAGCLSSNTLKYRLALGSVARHAPTGNGRVHHAEVVRAPKVVGEEEDA